MSEPETKSNKSATIEDKDGTETPTLESGSNEKIVGRVTRKVDLCIMPIVIMLYFLAFLDRSNIGNAKVAGLQTDLRLTNRQYSICLTVFYVSYIAVEIPTNLFLKKIGPNRLLPTMCVLWGVVTMCQGACKGFSSLVTCRFLLGVVEGGITPGLVLYMSHFYRRTDLQLRVSFLFAAVSMAGAFSGLLAFAIDNLDGVGGHRGWQFIFYLEGAASVLFGFICYFIMSNTPSEIGLIPKDELAIYNAALKADWSAVEDSPPFSWGDVARAFKDPQFYFLTPAIFCNGAIFYGLSFFMAPVVRSLGYSPNRTQLMTVPPFAVSSVVSLTFAYFADRYRQRGIAASTASVLAVIGYAMFFSTRDRMVSYGALFLQASGAYATPVAVSSWLANNNLPHYKRATILAWGFGVSSTGGILSTWLFDDPPRYPKGTRVNLSLSVIMVIFPLLNRAYLARQNRKKALVVASGDFDDSDEARRRLGDAHPKFEYVL